MVAMLTRTSARLGWMVRSGGASRRRRKSSAVKSGMASWGQDHAETYRQSDHGSVRVARSRRHRGWIGGGTSHTGICTAPVEVAQFPFRAVVGVAEVAPHRSARWNSVRRRAGSVPDDAHSRSVAAAWRAVKMTELPSVSPPRSGAADAPGAKITDPPTTIE